MGTKIEKRKPTEAEIDKMGIRNWAIWDSPLDDFDWSYDEKEVFFVLEGDAEIDAGDQKVRFGPGDLIICTPPFECRWKIHKRIKKHYKFG